MELYGVGEATVVIAGQGLDISGLKKTILYIPLSDETKLVQTSGPIRKADIIYCSI